MRKRKLKKYVLPTIIMTFSFIVILTVAIITKDNKNLSKEDNITYVSNTIISQDMAVINTTKKIINPYTDQSVTIGKNYYNYKAESAEQEKSIIYHENTYIQNSGVDFVYDKTFDVVAVLDGEVTNVKEDEILGKIIEISHNNEYVSIYQSLSEANVKKGDIISQGQVIGKSGKNELDKELGNHLHFEMYVGGQTVDPLLYLNKDVQD
ncbi:MAG: M23 family metallopeptidase [Bacilli bacterium]|nr:M23 family metallopeptidase [Bacilli bacterium]